MSALLHHGVHYVPKEWKSTPCFRYERRRKKHGTYTTHKEVLQQLWVTAEAYPTEQPSAYTTARLSEWRDVPTVEEGSR